MHTDGAYTFDLRDVRGQMGARRPYGDRPRSTAEYAEEDKETEQRGQGAPGRHEDPETESEAAM